MPGANCSIFGCSVSRRKKHKGISLFAIAPSSGLDPTKAEWKKKLISIITRDRVIDKELRRQIKEGKLHICERHFNPDDIEVSKLQLMFFCQTFVHILPCQLMHN